MTSAGANDAAAVLEVRRGDITRCEVDVIVNAANSSLLGGGGVDGAIHRAGGGEILAACRELRRTRWPDGLPTGEAAVTVAGNLPARYVVHVVGPVFHAERAAELRGLLRSCYRRAVEVAVEVGAESMAFPLISAGAYGWPVGDAAVTAVAALRASPVGQLRRIELVAFGEGAYEALTRAVAATG